MYELIGIEEHVYQERIDEQFKSDLVEKVVATFDSEQAAKRYIEKSKLKTPIYASFGGSRFFKSDTLLEMCKYAEVREHYPVTIPHNPEV